MDVGATAVEWDLQVSASGTPYAHHDDTLDRTTDGRGAFAESEDEDLAQLDAGAWFGPEFEGEPVPMLSAVIDALDARALRIYPEIKTFASPAHMDTIVRCVEERGWLNRTTFISMDWEALAAVRRLAPDVAIGYIVEAPERYPHALARAGEDPRAILDPDFRIALAYPELTRAAVKAGIPVAVWTVNETADADALLALGVSRFTTNEVERMLEWARSDGSGGSGRPAGIA